MSWLDDYANTASAFVDAPTQFQKVAAYWALGGALGKRVAFQFGMVPVYPNLYTVFVGKSGFIKKSITKNFALDVLGAALPDLDLPGRGSPEAFRDDLQERDWYGVLHYDEFFEYLVKGRKDYTADLDTTLMELFAYGRKTPIRTKTSGEIKIPPNAIISMIAPTTMDLLLRGIRKDDLMSGKMARFMFVAADQDIKYPVRRPRPHPTTPYLGTKLRALIPAGANASQPAQVMETPAARKTLEDYYYAIRARVKGATSPLFEGSFSRAQMYAIKLAMIHCIANGRMTLEPGDYDAIQPLISNWADCLDEIIKKVDVEDRFHELILRAEAFLKAHPTTTQRDIQRHMRLRKYEMSDVIEHLKVSGLIDIAMSTDAAASQIVYKGKADPAGQPSPDEIREREIEMAEECGPDPSGTTVTTPATGPITVMKPKK